MYVTLYDDLPQIVELLAENYPELPKAARSVVAVRIVGMLERVSQQTAEK